MVFFIKLRSKSANKLYEITPVRPTISDRNVCPFPKVVRQNVQLKVLFLNIFYLSLNLHQWITGYCSIFILTWSISDEIDVGPMAAESGRTECQTVNVKKLFTVDKKQRGVAWLYPLADPRGGGQTASSPLKVLILSF